ncbi:MAG TPA: 2'-5' RNA ligase family protein [Gammaproteobacteria bacterium]|nr:2'-5' RNA ligase family protein [Gammaproteobacteria bacterium]
MKLFNIALIPESKSMDVINCAKHFSGIAGQYLLGDLSLPHVTVYQFKARESEIDSVLNKVKSANIEHAINLSFETFSCITFDNKTHWASLMPDNVDELNHMHKTIASAINRPVKSNYDPHMTLMSTQQSDYELLVDSVKQNYRPISDKFVLSVGESDEVGQYLKVIHTF